MKKKLFLVLSVVLVASLLFFLTLIIFSFKNVDKGALQIAANVKSKVFLDGQQIGETPLCKCEQEQTIPVGSYEIKIEPIDTKFEAYTTRADINGGVLTVIDRTFLPGSLSSTYILTLEKINETKPELFISTLPDGAIVNINGNLLGATPFKSVDLKAAEHEVEILKQGFAKKTIRLKTINGHRLIVKVQLGTTDSESISIKNDTDTATTSAKTTPTPEITQTSPKGKITILETPNGFLRVRSGAGTNFDEVTRVRTGESFNIISEENGWYKILANGKEGFVSGDFVEKD